MFTRTILVALLAATWSAIGAAAAEVGGKEGKLSLVFEDDFEKGATRWEPMENKGEKGKKNDCWRIEETDKGKSFHQFKNYGMTVGSHRSPFNIALVKDLVLEDFVFVADVKSTVKDYGHRDACFFFGFQDPDHYYYVHLGLKRDSASHRILLVDGKPRTCIDEPLTQGTPWTDGWHHIKVVFDAAAKTATVYFDDMDKPHMKAENVKFTWGRIGVGSFDDKSMWDNVKIRGKVRKD